MVKRTGLLPFLGTLALLMNPVKAHAQLDFRNLDEGRPLRTEDAYPVERYAFELVAGYSYESEPGDLRAHTLLPELAYGIVSNGMIGFAAPLAAQLTPNGTDYGLAGVELFALFNFNTEAPLLPALSVRVDAAFPVGALAGDETALAFTGIATRSWGRTRTHVNAGATFAGGGGARWHVSGAVDRTLIRKSMLVGAELRVQEAGEGLPVELTGALGARMQLTPTAVIDLGIARRLRADVGPDLALTFGYSRAFAIAGLIPAIR